MEINYCPDCGNKLIPNSKFCSKCGKQIFKFKEEINNKEKTLSNQKKTNGFAIAGFVIALISLFTLGIGSILSFIFSLIGLTKSQKEYDGQGLSIAGIVISVISFSMLLAVIFYLFIWLAIAVSLF